MTFRPPAIIPTISGCLVDLRTPTPDTIRLGDIAHSLSRQCRWVGHVRTHFSVAQHSVLVSHRVPPELALAALMHDAHEAYVGDLSRGLKSALWSDDLQQICPEWDLIDRRMRQVVRAKFGLPEDDAPEVEEADNRMAATEFRDLLGEDSLRLTNDWPAVYVREFAQPYPERVVPWPPEEARFEFGRRYGELHVKRVQEETRQLRSQELRHLAGAAQQGGSPHVGSQSTSQRNDCHRDGCESDCDSREVLRT